MSDHPLTRYLISGTDVRVWNDDDPAKFKSELPVANEQWVKWAEVEPLLRELTHLQRAEKTGSLCPQCGFETITSSVTMESFELLCHERDELEAECERLLRELKIIRAERAAQQPELASFGRGVTFDPKTPPASRPDTR